MKGENDVFWCHLKMLVSKMTESHPTGKTSADNLSLVLIQDTVNEILVAKIEKLKETFISQFLALLSVLLTCNHRY